MKILEHLLAGGYKETLSVLADQQRPRIYEPQSKELGRGPPELVQQFRL